MDLEWDTPVGPAKSVGGDAMFRLSTFSSSRGFDVSVMAGEEPQLCLRLRHAQWNILRVDAEMSLHDAAITRFGQSWRRQVRGGYGAMDVYRRFEIGGERLFAKQTHSAMMWAIGWPAAMIGSVLFGLAFGLPDVGLEAAAIIFFAMPAQILRLTAKCFARGVRPRTALAYGALTMLGKWAWFLGQMKYRSDRARGERSRLIEYKQPTPQSAGAAR